MGSVVGGGGDTLWSSHLLRSTAWIHDRLPALHRSDFSSSRLSAALVIRLAMEEKMMPWNGRIENQ